MPFFKKIFKKRPVKIYYALTGGNYTPIDETNSHYVYRIYFTPKKSWDKNRDVKVKKTLNKAFSNIGAINVRFNSALIIDIPEKEIIKKMEEQGIVLVKNLDIL